MITIRRSEERGHANHGWLDSFHTFSFAEYRDPDFNGFSVLRVVNEDRVEPGQGFGTHGHADMEIVSYVLDGTLEHRDSMGNGSQLRSGEVQLMSAGSGVTHSEFNPSKDERTHFLQMWILPANEQISPRYEQREFPAEHRAGTLRLVVSSDGADGSLTIGQDARLLAGTLQPGESTEFELPADRSAWVQIARGSVDLNGETLGPGDGAAVQLEEKLTFRGVEDAEVLVWELPR